MLEYGIDFLRCVVALLYLLHFNKVHSRLLVVFRYIILFFHSFKRAQVKEESLDLTRSVGNGIHEEDKSSYVTSDEIDITGNHENLQDPNTQQLCVGGRNNQILKNQV